MPADQDDSQSDHSARDLLREMWAHRRLEARTELESLCSTLESLVHSPSDTEVRVRAQNLAHQLAGAFGIFGFSESKAKMARIDIELADPTVPVQTLLVSAREILVSLP